MLERNSISSWWESWFLSDEPRFFFIFPFGHEDNSKSKKNDLVRRTFSLPQKTIKKVKSRSVVNCLLTQIIPFKSNVAFTSQHIDCQIFLYISVLFYNLSSKEIKCKFFLSSSKIRFHSIPIETRNTLFASLIYSRWKCVWKFVATLFIS